MFRKERRLTTVAAIFLLVGCCNEAPISQNKAGEPVAEAWLRSSMGFRPGVTCQEIKERHSDAHIWLETELDGASFMFCATSLPSYGNARKEIIGWTLRPPSKEWQELISFRVAGVAAVTLEIDRESGRFSAMAGSNTFDKHAVCTFDLNAAGI